VNAAEDQADVDKVLAGDISAFEGIVNRWQRALVNLAYRFCLDRGRSEEMAQEVFLRAYRSLSQWRKEAAFSTWLFALAMNLYRSELRKIPPRMLSIQDLPDVEDYSNLDGALEAKDRDRAIRSAVLALPSRYREVLVLFYFHNLDVAATARTLGVPEGTVKARLFRGKKTLRARLSRLLSAHLATKEA
jgi:RNA polymerase sigma-70 factor, ECF subfamily